MIDVLIADDERPALDELEHLLRADERIGTIVRAGSGAEAIRALSERAVDAAFLDIHMPGLSGLDLARAISQFAVAPAIVFVTADEARALEAFEVHAVDYLLKPLRPERLRRAIERIVRPAAASVPPTGGSQPVSASDDDETLPVQVGSTIRLVRRSDVRYVQAQGDYSRLHTGQGSHLVRIPISDLEQRWTGAGFVRVHRSFLVRGTSVTALRLSGAEPNVAIGDIVLPVSRRLVAAVREALVRPEGGTPR
ncbi:LytTR family DNA-binding domain-containing protein [Microbacterium sp. BWT-B31]|uniref:LytR/AlgR family response regulator transcription factor n=1 Tax=Microbacterium sp. BWT-B31 TaxID=3232072 RepID=UPI003529A45B